MFLPEPERRRQVHIWCAGDKKQVSGPRSVDVKHSLLQTRTPAAEYEFRKELQRAFAFLPRPGHWLQSPLLGELADVSLQVLPDQRQFDDPDPRVDCVGKCVVEAGLPLPRLLTDGHDRNVPAQGTELVAVSRIR